MTEEPEEQGGGTPADESAQDTGAEPREEQTGADAAPADEPAGAPSSESQAEEPGPQAGSPADAESHEPTASERPPDAEKPTPAGEAEAVGSDEEAARAQGPEPPEAAETGAASSAEPSGEAPAAEAAPPPAGETPGSPEDVRPAEPREKPEIPGADLEPVFIPQEDQYLDAEAQAAAEAEAEAEAARIRAEAEDIQSKPIAHAAIDLAAGARYTATGKRKSAVARVILKPGKGSYAINDKPLDAYFPRDTLQRMIRQPLESVGYESRMDVVARMHGGGVSAQAGALRHGISRALIVADPNLRGELKRRGFLTRDPRVKERKKAGLKKARKRPQFSKR